MSVIGKASASPTKAFFVRMLTRDIELSDCVFDLLDNSIDGAWQASGKSSSTFAADQALTGFKVEIKISDTEFNIKDNCGGISLDAAQKYAFTFGRSPQAGQPNGTVGVYGIGMKRAVFKLGNKIKVKSSHNSGGNIESFEVPIDVDKWLQNEGANWDFDISETLPLEENGVEISVGRLTEETANEFRDPSFEQRMRREIAREYMMPIMRGLEIVVNGSKVRSRQLNFRKNSNFSPMRSEYKDGGVSIVIVAGMQTLPPNDLDADNDNKRQDQDSGWYVACNGRVVVTADKTTLTGWGLNLPKWHSQYQGFLGIVLMSSDDPSELPMTTTKRSVDPSSLLYRRTLVRMTEPARAWTRYTNSRKQYDDLRDLENEDFEQVNLFDVPPSPALALPVASGSKRGSDRPANVSYAVAKPRLRRLATALGDASMSYREVGLQTFDLAYDDLVGE
ncbi:ATP-binding protein [Rhodococcus sp. ANT_H53B]|uniref:ATP-binding protein n=1 Tax=Rhodococcus sp. ANT_H53B TaxID=2597357 RepID=UPI0011EDE126|nr:ATP-binding protein [Rhodococcus sp. ANT_H53B]KAA0922680.1 ATP-binding protein [Rhodococcus sp. ANT_H53B]